MASPLRRLTSELSYINDKPCQQKPETGSPNPPETTEVAVPKKNDEEAFMASLPPMHMLPLWTQMSKMVPPNPNPSAAPVAWKYAQVRPSLMEAGDLVGAEEAERRVLMLVNPSLDAPYTTDTIYGGLQLILPNETAPAHRHVAFALRFIIEGEKGFTAVEGEKMVMERGDVILTPPWHWHDHGNEGTEPVIWLDGLDLPLFRHAPVNFAENFTESRYPSENSPTCEWRHPWSAVLASFATQVGPHRIHHYCNLTGAPLSHTIGAQAEMIAPSHITAFHQETTSFIYHCYEGTGKTHIITPGGVEMTIEWVAKDTFTVPAWSKIVHTNLSEEETAYLFAVNDKPLLTNLGLFRAA